jgi:hypothetical protein
MATATKSSTVKKTSTAGSAKYQAEKEHISEMKTRDKAVTPVRSKRHVVCPVCGAWVNLKHNFCYNCGQRFTSENTKDESVTESSSPIVTPTSDNITSLSDVRENSTADTETNKEASEDKAANTEAQA